jgi:hypothetical protein
VACEVEGPAVVLAFPFRRRERARIHSCRNPPTHFSRNKVRGEAAVKIGDRPLRPKWEPRAQPGKDR